MTPYEIRNVSQSVFSVARHYGGMNGYHYIYDPRQDILIREDVFRERIKEQTKAEKERKNDIKGRQGTLI